MMNAVVAHLWQSTLFAGLAALLTVVFRTNRASTRYCMWLAASLKFLIPMSPLVTVVRNFTWQTASIRVMAISPILTRPMAASPGVPVTDMVPAMATNAGPSSLDIATILTLTWACGSAILFIWWLIRWLRMRAVLSASTAFSLAAPIPVRSSPSAFEPGLFGIIRPVVVLPESATADLSAQQLDAILVHELAHWRRRDNLTAALHMIVEGLFWFHPLVWWIGGRLVVEREKACDEAVLEINCDRQAYAEAIMSICRGYLRHSLLNVSGVAGGDLKDRIAMIMTAQVGRKLRTFQKLLLAGVTCAAIAAPIAIGTIGAWRAAAADMDDGLSAFAHGDYASSLARLRPLADRGNATAEDSVGQLYDQGLGVRRDYAQAVTWFRKAALQGDPSGQQDLAMMYAAGHGVPQDSLAAALWGRQGLLQMLEGGCDPKLMFETQLSGKAALQAAAERGDPEAASHLGSLYEMGFFDGGHINRPDHSKALIWISKAAGQGNAKGEAALASLYLSGSALPPDSTAAVTWMRKAAQQGLERAQCSLAVMYDKGIGVDQDHAEAAKWYRGLIVSTDRNGTLQDWARSRLAIFYETGDGVPHDDDEAVTWLRSAADHGYPFAETMLGIRYADGSASQRDYAAAAKLLGSAAKKGVPSAQIALGKLYADGHGVPLNLTVAYKWFDLASRYSTSNMERDEARKDRDDLSTRMSQAEIALADRLVARWLPADEIMNRMHAGGDM